MSFWNRARAAATFTWALATLGPACEVLSRATCRVLSWAAESIGSLSHFFMSSLRLA